MTKPHDKELLDRVREAIWVKHYSMRTEQAYVNWIKRYIVFHDKRHPLEIGATEIEAYLTHLAVDQNVAASTQNQVLSAILFLYRNVLKKDLERPLAAMSGTQQLIARVLYGSGARLIEGLRLRGKDVDFAQHQIIVRDGKGQKDRVTMLPTSLVEPL